MSHPVIHLQAAGVSLAIASFLMAGAIIAHGPIDPDLNQQIQHIAQTAPQWIIVHWISAAGLSLFAITGLIVLSAQSWLTNVWWTVTAWGVLTVGALWTMTTAVVEATVSRMLHWQETQEFTRHGQPSPKVRPTGSCSLPWRLP